MINPEFKEATTKEEFVANFTAARERILQAVNGLSDSDLDKPVIDEFSSKDLIAHILEWDYFALCNSKIFLSGGDPDFSADEDNDVFNEIAVSIWRDKPGPVVLEEFKNSTQAVLGYVNSLSEEELFRDRGLRFIDKEGNENVVNLPWFLGEFDHDIGHANEMRSWREQSGK